MILILCAIGLPLIVLLVFMVIAYLNIDKVWHERV